jgi:hypothetical protein
MGFTAFNPSFCNGPLLVNPFCVVPFAGVLLLYGVGAEGRHLMGSEEDRPTNLRTRGRGADWMGCGLA